MMTIELLTSSPNSLVVDEELPNLPEEIKSTVTNPVYNFYILGPWEENKIFELSSKQLYRREDNRIERMDYTGDIYFGDIYYLDGDKDLELIFKAVFIKGLLDNIEVFSERYHCNHSRKEAQSAFFSAIKKQARLEVNLAYKFIYKPYRAIVQFLLKAVKGLLFVLYKTIDKLISLISKILTPL